MGLISEIFAGGAKGVFEGIGSLAKDVREAITGDISAEKKAQIQSRLVELEYLSSKAQSDINLAEAQNPNLFVSGWRPAIGWICGLALAYTFIGYSIIEWCLKFSGSDVQPPELHTGYLMELVVSMLGLGGLRTFEKLKGVASK